MPIRGRRGERRAGEGEGEGVVATVPNHVMGVKELKHTHAHTLTLTQRNVDA